MQDDAGTSGTSAVATEVAPVTAPDRRLHSDPHDFAGLYIRHHSSFTAHARRYLRDQRDADEVVQEAFLRLFLALPELETELQALAYCRRTITNLCIDRYRSQARRPRLVDLDSAPVDLLVDDDPGDPVVRAEDAALVREALSLLSPLHREALVKREVEEKPLPVIAQELSIPEDNVKHLLFRARRALRKLLAGTALAPGIDDERGENLVSAGRAGSGGLGALVLLIVLGLGSGPNLEAVPVVGVDLPDVLGVSKIVRTVGEAVTGVVDHVSSSGAPAAGAVRPAGADSPTGSTAGAAGPERGSAGGAAGGPASGSALSPSGAAGAGAQTAPTVPAGESALLPQTSAAGVPGGGSVLLHPVPSRPVTPSDPRPVSAAGPAVRGPQLPGSGRAPAAPDLPAVGSGTGASQPVPGGGRAGAAVGSGPSAPVPAQQAKGEARAEAQQAKAEARAEAKQAKVEARAEAKQAKVEARAEAQQADGTEAQRARAEAQADAKRARAEAQADAKRARAEAQADAKRARAEAQADAKRARAEAQADAKRAKAQAEQARASVEQGPAAVEVAPSAAGVTAGG